MATQNAESFPRPQYQSPSYTVSIREIVEHPTDFLQLPEFQREFVWARPRQKLLINSVLGGKNVHPLEGYQEHDENLTLVWRMTDGQQRLHTVNEFFNDGFRTLTPDEKQRIQPNSHGPIEPGKFYSDLSLVAKQIFLAYRFMFVQTARGNDPRELTARFMEINEHTPLNAAEKLNMYMSTFTSAARDLANHPFWKSFYIGKTERFKVFQAALHLLILEVSPSGLADLQNNRLLHEYASGMYDHKLDDTTIALLHARLNIMMKVYQGTTFSVRASIVPMYQAVRFMQEAKVDLSTLREGVLSSWIYDISAPRILTNMPRYVTPLQQLLRKSEQQEFWRRNLDRMLSLVGNHHHEPLQVEKDIVEQERLPLA